MYQHDMVKAPSFMFRASSSFSNHAPTDFPLLKCRTAGGFGACLVLILFDLFASLWAIDAVNTLGD